MVGASGLVAANWLSNIAPRDGTVLMTFVHTAAFEPLYGNAAAKFDPAKLTWIGNMDEGIGTCGVSRASGVSSVDDLRKRETIFGGTGATGPLPADAAKMQIDIVPASGIEVEAFIARVSASSPAVVERARRAIRND